MLCAGELSRFSAVSWQRHCEQREYMLCAGKFNLFSAASRQVLCEGKFDFSSAASSQKHCSNSSTCTSFSGFMTDALREKQAHRVHALFSSFMADALREKRVHALRWRVQSLSAASWQMRASKASAGAALASSIPSSGFRADARRTKLVHARHWRIPSLFSGFMADALQVSTCSALASSRCRASNLSIYTATARLVPFSGFLADTLQAI
jgi:hypothetical protein